jgi:hypothetical protein
MTEITVHRQFSSKKYDTFAATFPLNGNHVFVTFKVRRDVLIEKPLQVKVKFEREARQK